MGVVNSGWVSLLRGSTHPAPKVSFSPVRLFDGPGRLGGGGRGAGATPPLDGGRNTLEHLAGQKGFLPGILLRHRANFRAWWVNGERWCTQEGPPPRGACPRRGWSCGCSTSSRRGTPPSTSCPPAPPLGTTVPGGGGIRGLSGPVTAMSCPLSKEGCIPSNGLGGIGVVFPLCGAPTP